jgi:hypothetical protein
VADNSPPIDLKIYKMRGGGDIRHFIIRSLSAPANSIFGDMEAEINGVPGVGSSLFLSFDEVCFTKS